VLGLTTLLRHNPWLLVPFVLLAIQVRFLPVVEKVVVGGPGLHSGFHDQCVPWMWRSKQSVGTPWYFMIPLQGSN